MKFIMIVLCFFVTFHLVAYYALFRHISQNPKGRILSALGILFHFCVTIGFACLLFLRVEMPHFLYAFLSLTSLNAVLFFTFGIINIAFLIAFCEDAKKRTFSAQMLCLACVACIVASIINASRLPNVAHTDIYLPNLRTESNILVISDLHLSNLISLQKVRKIIDLANAQNADTIVLVGDIIDSKPHIMEKFLPELGRLSAKNGVYFVLGNHEFIFGAQMALEQIASLKNIAPLVNDGVIIDENYALLGVSDLSAKRFGGELEADLDVALNMAKNKFGVESTAESSVESIAESTAESIADSSVESVADSSVESSAESSVESNAESSVESIADSTKSTDFADFPKILLSHQPNIIKHIDAKKVDLILSGHTHGGQIFPFSIGAYFANPFLYGLKNIGGTQLFISQGAHLAVTYGRFLSRAEINLITLKKEGK